MNVPTPMARTAALLISLAWLCAVPGARAERVIVTPAGSILAPRQASVEGLLGVDRHTRRETWVNTTVKLVEFEGVHLQAPGREATAVSAQLGVLPETFVTPSISLGARDIFNNARRFADAGYAGRSLYIVAGKSLLDTQAAPYPLRNAAFTVGYGGGTPRAVFGSVSADFGFGFRQSVEYDGRSLNYRLSRQLGGIGRIEYERLHGRNYVGLEFRTPIPM